MLLSNSDNNSSHHSDIESQEIPIEPLRKWINEAVCKRLYLLETMKTLLEIICENYWDCKWPEGLSSTLSNMLFSLSKHNISCSFKTQLCIAEILFDQFEKDPNDIHYLELARKIFNKLSSLLITSDLTLSDTENNTMCRALWLRGLMDRSAKSSSANNWFKQCQQLISN